MKILILGRGYRGVCSTKKFQLIDQNFIDIELTCNDNYLPKTLKSLNIN